MRDERTGARGPLALGSAAAVAAAALALAACGGGSNQAPAATPGPRPALAARWGRQVEAFAAGLAGELERLGRGTRGAARGVPIGPRLDPRVLVDGPRRRAFAAAAASLLRCRRDLDARVPPAPSPRLRPVRTALRNACAPLSSAARSAALAARATGGRPGGLALARAGAGEGIRLLVDALAILRRALGRPAVSGGSGPG